MAKYTRVKDKETGHEYDVLSHRVDEAKHELVDKKHYPDTSQPRAPKPNVKGKRTDEKPAAAKPARSGRGAAKSTEKSEATDAAATDGPPS